MEPPTEQPSRAMRFQYTIRESSLFLFYLAVAQVVSSAFLAQWGRDISNRLGAWLDGSMPRPFAFRQFAPWVLEKMLAVLPAERIENWLQKPVGSSAEDQGIRVVDQALATYRVTDVEALQLVLVDLGLVVTVLATAYVWRMILRACALPNAVRWLAPGLFLLALPVHFANGGYIYDFFELFFASLATWAVVTRRWMFFYPVLAFAVLNKESAILLSLVGIVFVLRKDTRGALIHAGLCAVFGLVPFLWVRFAMAGREGLDMIHYAAHNAAYLASPSPWLGRARVFHPLLPYPSALNLLLVALFVAFIGTRFRSRPLELRVTFLALLLATLPLFLLFGYESEVRVFALCFPAGMALASFTLAELLAEKTEPTRATSHDHAA